MLRILNKIHLKPNYSSPHKRRYQYFTVIIIIKKKKQREKHSKKSTTTLKTQLIIHAEVNRTTIT